MGLKLVKNLIRGVRKFKTKGGLSSRLRAAVKSKGRKASNLGRTRFDKAVTKGAFSLVKRVGVGSLVGGFGVSASVRAFRRDRKKFKRDGTFARARKAARR